MTVETLEHYVAGEWVTGDGASVTTDVNPSDASEELARIPQADGSLVDRAAGAASDGFKVWSRMSGPDRAELLHKAANLLAERRDDLARTVALEVGKPIGEAVQEVKRGVVILRYFAEEAVHPIGQVIPAQQAGSLQFSLRQPIGPILIISPWNFPVAIPLWKLAPAIAFGNAVVWKAAEVASLTATRLVQVLDDAGLPSGVVNLVHGKGSVTGNALVAHEAIRAITFTGSEQVGMNIAAVAAKRNVKYQLEMGGKNAAIVLPDADLQQAASLVAAGAMRFAGQKCTATSRTVVAEDVLEPFLAKLDEAVSALPLAPAIDPSSAIGPLITQDSLENVRSYAEEAARTGRLITGGTVVEGDSRSRGYFFEPTVVADIPPDARVAQEEVFGPLLVVHTVDSVDEAIEVANSTRYGLSVSLFTRDINSALDYIHRVDSGMVRVNGDTTGVDPHAPFGGMRASSSHSREQGPAAVEFFTETKTVQINPAATSAQVNPKGGA
ncbi:MAG: aldehyde dehydrogenase family protein [Chloroflexota bacterium]|nr:aldehyde dehydrogenase family protein [Chloroflexota bacterium]